MMANKTKREVAGSYDALGGRLYDIRYRQEQEAKYEVITSDLNPGPLDLVLDDGCGTGMLLKRLDSCYVGVDLSMGLLSTARDLTRELANSHIILADADALPFRHHVFDAVFAVTLIQNTPDPERTLDEIVYASREGARVAITALRKTFTVESFSELLASSGLRLEKMMADKCLQDLIALTIADGEPG
ncbi:MAG: methyltransferase domain-containing protein [Candidatus Bathyarchaeota archaeon]|nr:MAG: methyltransferase domain-containing protein [Candidatus Bathyarchaeota archaeon]